MYITLDVNGARCDVVVDAQPEATVGELVTAMGEPITGRDVSVDGRAVALDDRLVTCGLRRGSVVTIGGSTDRQSIGGGLSLVTVGGLRSGERFWLRSGRSIVGRGDEADVRLDHPTVSRRHAEVTATH